MSQIGKPTEIESRAVVTWGWREWGRLMVNGYEVSFGGNENILKLIAVKLCEYTKSH